MEVKGSKTQWLESHCICQLEEWGTKKSFDEGVVK